MTVLVPAQPVWPQLVYDLAVEHVKATVDGTADIPTLTDRIVRAALNSAPVAQHLVEIGYDGWRSAMELDQLPVLTRTANEVDRLKRGLQNIAHWDENVSHLLGQVTMREYAQMVLDRAEGPS